MPFQYPGADQNVGEVPFNVSAIGWRHESSDLCYCQPVRATHQGEFCGPFAGFSEIHVGEGLIGRYGIDVLEHATGEIGVQVQRQYQKTIETEFGPHPFQNVSFSVILTDRGGGTVEM